MKVLILIFLTILSVCACISGKNTTDNQTGEMRVGNIKDTLR